MRDTYAYQQIPIKQIPIVIKPTVSIKRENIEKYLKKQYEEDTCFVKPAKEVLFVGRTNSGKSTLINKLLMTNICHTSRHPVNLKGNNEVLQFL